jgi:hypothetical protein
MLSSSAIENIGNPRIKLFDSVFDYFANGLKFPSQYNTPQISPILEEFNTTKPLICGNNNYLPLDLGSPFSYENIYSIANLDLGSPFTNENVILSSNYMSN